MEEENHYDESDMGSNDICSIEISIRDDTNTNQQTHSPSLILNSGFVDDNCATTTMSKNEPTNDSHHQRQQPTSTYTSKKPLWWRRQSGRKISPRQRQAKQEIQQLGLQLILPTTITNNDTDHAGKRPQLVDWQNIFPTFRLPSVDSLDHGDEIWFEIGFGLGDNLLCLASTSPERTENNSFNSTRRTFYVGAEIHNGGVGTICTRIQSANQEKMYWTGYTLFDKSTQNNHINADNTVEPPLYNNVRLYMGDGIKLLPFIPDNSISVVLITFPDPFMGTNQSSYRILQLDVLRHLQRILISPQRIANSVNDINNESMYGSDTMPRHGGRMYLATDHFGYHNWCHEQVSAFNNETTRQRELPEANPSSEGSSTIMGPVNVQAIGESDIIVSDTGTFQLVEPTPDRSHWLPVISKYEQKGYDDGRKTYLSCWEVR